MAGSQTITMVIAGDASRLVKSLKIAGKETTLLGKTTKAFAATAGLAFAAATVAAVTFITKSVKAASNLAETVNKVDTVFGKSAKTLEAFAKTTADTLGQSQEQFLSAASTFGIFGKAAGLAGDKNVEFSKKLTILASDLASFNNTPVDEAILALGAALRGEAEPIRRFGALLDDASLKAQALSMGIYNGKGILTPQQRVLAAYQLILKQTKVQQGDFSRTADGLANASRRVNALWTELQTAVGQKFLPIIIDVLPDLVAGIKQLTADPKFNAALNDLASTLKKNLPDILNSIPDVVTGITGLVSATTDFLKAAAPVLNFLSQPLFPGTGLNLGGISYSQVRQGRANFLAPQSSAPQNVTINVNAVSSSAETGKAVANALSNYYRTGGRQVK